MKRYLFITALILTFNFLLSTLNCSAQSPNWVWANSATGTSYDEGNSTAVDASGNIYVTGYFQSPTLVFGSITLNNAGSNDIFLAKFDAGGNVIWAKSAGGTDDDYSLSVAVDASGNAFVTGWFASSSIVFGSITLTNTGYGDIFLVKYDAGGNVLWAKSAGGDDGDGAYSVTVDAVGNSYITGGFSSSTLVFGSTTLINSTPNYDDIFIAKYDANGNVIWAKSAGGTGYEVAFSVAVDDSSNAYVTGQFSSHFFNFDTTATLTNTGTDNIFIAKFNSNGKTIWAQSASGASDDNAYSVALDTSGNVFVAGGFLSDSISFDSTVYLINSGNEDIFIAKYNASGDVLWAKSAGGTSDDGATSVAVDASGNAYLTGFFMDSLINFSSVVLTNSDNSGNTNDVFLTKYDKNGNVVWAKSAGGIGDDVANSIAVDASGNSFITGYFYSPSATFGSIVLNNTDNSGTTDDFFIAKLNRSAGINEINNSFSISVFPNPTTDNLTIDVSTKLNLPATIEISNIEGQVIKQQTTNFKTTNLVVSAFPSGIYILEVITEKGMAVKKFVKE